MHRLFFILACLLLLPFGLLRTLAAPLYPDSIPLVTDPHQLLEPGRHRLSIPVGGFDRKVIVVTPTNFKPGTPLPLVFFLHGAGGTAQQALHTYGWAEKADAENFFVAFPEGLPYRPESESNFLLNPPIWRDGRAGTQVAKVDDVDFFAQLLKQLEAALPIDQRRIYITGFSNGAGMTFTLGAHFCDRIAAIAPVSSQSFAKVESLARPVSVYYLTGTADPLIPYHGGTVTLPWGNTRTTPPVQESVDTWVALDSCSSQPQIVSDSIGVRVVRYSSVHDNSEVLFTTVERNGHHWPDTREPLPQAISGPTLDPFNATDRIWDFFKKHSLPEAGQRASN
jgi:polyhydroxybutyrate depolymerase